MAIKTLATLIKIHKQKADFLRREMIALEEESHQLELLADKLRREHEQEMKLVIDDPALARYFGSYSTHVKKKIAAIREEIKNLQESIEKKRIEISEEYSEQKKYEIASDNIKKKMQEEERHRLQKRFDEVGSQQYQRLKENPV